MPSTIPAHLTVPLTAIAHDWAQQFANQQANPQKGKQVYLNTLAVWAVHRYLTWLQVDNDLERSDSWNPRLNSLVDAADLVLPAIGRLECRPVLPDQTEFTVPPESRGTAPDARTGVQHIGCVAVQLDESLLEGQLLGFIAQEAIADDVETLALSALQPLDQLLEFVSQWESRAIAPESSQAIEPSLTQLGRWLQNQYEIGWQSVEALFGDRTPSLAFRGASVRRAKPLELYSHRNLANYWQQFQRSDEPEEPIFSNGDRLSSLAFIVSLTPETPEQICIHLQVCNLGDRAELPPYLRLQVLTETGEVFREVTSQANDTFMQYEFTGQPGEQFSVEVALGDARIRETFVI